MPVLPKYLLKQFFESGDLITQTTLDDLIEATYNPTLVAGVGVFLSQVVTPSGTTITISATGAIGTVTSVSSLNSTFINTNVTSPTTTPVIQSALSATGIPSATTYLRGDNTWATVSGGTITSASNIGLGTGVFSSLVGTDLQFKSLVAGSNIIITNTASEITIASSGGNTGATGPQGTAGTLYGASGATGVQGNQGFQGNIGNQGFQGFQGYQGFQGAQGFQGNTGEGASGATGIGTQGPAGNIGATGSGGGGGSYQAGDGIDIDTGTSPDTIEIDLSPGCGSQGPNLGFDAADSNSLDFLGVHIRDEGSYVGTYPTINFIGMDVLAQDSGDPCVVNVYVPVPTFASHYNTNDGTTIGIVYETGITRNTLRISNPWPVGTPSFKTNGWAGTNQATTDTALVSLAPFSNQFITGFSAPGVGDCTITVEVFDADGTSFLAAYTTPVLNADGPHSSIPPNDGIDVIISGYTSDTSKWKAKIQTSIDMSLVFFTNSLDGGRYHIKTTMHTDTATDGGVNYSYTQSDVFYDTRPNTPAIAGPMAISETLGSLQVKHLSGVEYYILNSDFTVDVSGMNWLNGNTQGYSLSTSRNFRITGAEYGLTSYNLQAWSPLVGNMVGWTNQWDLATCQFQWIAWPITLTNYRYRGANANGTVTVSDGYYSTPTHNGTDKSVLIDTVTSLPTNLGESFNDESQRLIRGPASYSAWVSSTALSNGVPNMTGPASPFSDACTVGSYILRADKYWLTDTFGAVQPDLTTFKPNSLGSNPNMSGITNTAVYSRKFYTSSVLNITNFTLAFGGIFPGGTPDATSALLASQLKIYIRRVASNIGGTSVGHNANPLAVHGALFDSGAPTLPFDDGASGVDSVGSLIRLGSSSGNSVNCTFGIQWAVTGFWIEVQIVDSNIELEFINCTLQFSDNSTESNPV